MSSEGQATFSPEQRGTDEESWNLSVGTTRRMPEVTIDSRAIVVAAAHPDDETLGCGGLIHRAISRGVPVVIVLASWGEASHPHSTVITSEAMAVTRAGEMRTAMHLLGGPRGAGSSSTAVQVIGLGLPDGALSRHQHRITTEIVEAIAAQDRQVLLLATWRQDGHPDHETVGRCAAAAAARTDAELLEYPIWFWHWGEHAELPIDMLVVHRLNETDRRVKSAAIAAHASQVSPLSDDVADAPVLPEQVLSHFRWDTELFVRDPLPRDSSFEDLHRADSDPWSVNSDYEVAKRRATLEMLSGFPTPLRALEIGCSVGALTGDLADACHHVDGLEASSTAAELARRRTAWRSNVRILDGAAPLGLPEGPYDLVVLSEVGYFLSPRDLRRTLSLVRARLQPDALIVSCHWKHPIEGWLLRAAQVDAAITEEFGTPQRAQTYEDYDLAVWHVNDGWGSGREC